MPPQLRPQVSRSTKTAGTGNPIQPQLPPLNQPTSQSNPFNGQPSQRRSPQLRAKPPMQCRRTRSSSRRQVGDSQRPPQLLPRPSKHRCQRSIRHSRHRTFNELPLPTIPMPGENQPPTDSIGDLSPMVPLNQMQSKIKRSRATRSGQHRPVINKQHVRLNRNQRITTDEQISPPPMRSSPPPIQHSRISQRKRARAEAHQPSAPSSSPSNRRENQRTSRSQRIRPVGHKPSAKVAAVVMVVEPTGTLSVGDSHEELPDYVDVTVGHPIEIE
jgi:hypothetical protein